MNKILSVIIIVILIIFGFKYYSVNKNRTYEQKVIEFTRKDDSIRFDKIVSKTKDFIQKNKKYNDKIVFLIDMKKASNKNRFFVFDLDDNKIVDQGLVAHGSGSATSDPRQLKFSNVDGSYATSLGRYSIGYSYTGIFGKAYKLYGLDSTNSNAFSRAIVLHKYDKMPYDEDQQVYYSQGCPMVNRIFFDRLAKIIDSSSKEILLDISY